MRSTPALLFLMCVLPASVQAEDRWAGSWEVHRNGSRVATLELTATGAGGYRFERWTGPRVERGTAKRVGRRGLITVKKSLVSPGILSVLISPIAAAPRLRLTLSSYRMLSSGRVARGTIKDSARLGARTETLRRRATRGGVPGNRVDLLVDTQAFPAMEQAIRAAKRTISLQTFSWIDDSVGRRLASLLAAKAREGVRVRCLVDAYHQDSDWQLARLMRAGGVAVRLHHTLGEGIKNTLLGGGREALNTINRLALGGALWSFLAPPERPPAESRGVLNHDHRKVLVVDGRVGFTGGMNLGAKYANGRWHDVHCRVEGPAVRQLSTLFFERWRASGGSGQPDPDPIARDPRWRPGSTRVDVVQNLPGRDLQISARYLREIRGARREVRIENPYVLHDPIVRALKNAVRRGVRVVLVVPDAKQLDEKLVVQAFSWISNDLVRAGIQLYRYHGRMSHGKVATFDRRVATVGSANLDAFSMVHNAELNLFVPDVLFTADVNRRVFEVDLRRSTRSRVEKRGTWAKIKSKAVHFFRGFL